MTAQTLSENEGDNSELVSCSKKTAKIKKYRPFTQKYDPLYLKYGFVSDKLVKLSLDML